MHSSCHWHPSGGDRLPESSRVTIVGWELFLWWRHCCRIVSGKHERTLNKGTLRCSLWLDSFCCRRIGSTLIHHRSDFNRSLKAIYIWIFKISPHQKNKKRTPSAFYLNSSNKPQGKIILKICPPASWKRLLSKFLFNFLSKYMSIAPQLTKSSYMHINYQKSYKCLISK